MKRSIGEKIMARNRRLRGLAVVGLVVLGWLAPVEAASLSWSGLGGDALFTNVDNWSGTPTGGLIDPLNLVDLYTIDDGAATVVADELRFDSAAGGGLTILNGSLPLSGTTGLRAVTFDNVPDVPVQIGGNGHLGRQFLREVVVSLGGTATLELNGAGNPVNVSTIDFATTTSVLQFNAETPAQFQSEHLSKITVNGNPALVGYNIQVDPFNGDAGSQVMATNLDPVVPQSLTWTGLGADPTDFADLDNWSGAPAAGVIDINNLIDHYLVDDAAAAIAGTAALAFEGGSLTVEAGSVTLTGGTAGLGKLGGTSGTIGMGGDAAATVQFLADVAATLDNAAVLTLNGGGNPVNQSTIDLLSFDTVVNFMAETPADFETEHLSKITVNGAPAVIGVNLSVTPFNGDAGAQVMAMEIPEPSSALLLAVGMLGAVALRRRR
jgi:hypothetical protein